MRELPYMTRRLRRDGGHMDENTKLQETVEAPADLQIPGTAQIRRIASQQSPMELLMTAEHLASGGYPKKLFSVLSRVFTEHKGFHGEEQEGMRALVHGIMNSQVPSELKMQTFTSFELPGSLKPDARTAEEWVKSCANKRINIAAYFLAGYDYGRELYTLIMSNKNLLRFYVTAAKPEALLEMFETVIEKESKEDITGLTRMIRNVKRRYSYTDKQLVRRVTDEVFASKKVFFTSKLLYCLAFSVPADCLPDKKELIKILRICVNYEEKTAKDFVRRYHLDFDVSDKALCTYFLGNKKTEKERPLVVRFATHLVRIEDEGEKRKLLHNAFKRGGLFRMYAGCMQDGGVNEEKQRHFHYTDEQIEWVKTLPGLCKDETPCT